LGGDGAVGRPYGIIIISNRKRGKKRADEVFLSGRDNLPRPEKKKQPLLFGVVCKKVRDLARKQNRTKPPQKRIGVSIERPSCSDETGDRGRVLKDSLGEDGCTFPPNKQARQD